MAPVVRLLERSAQLEPVWSSPDSIVPCWSRSTSTSASTRPQPRAHAGRPVPPPHNEARLEGIAQIIAAERPDMVLVQGHHVGVRGRPRRLLRAAHTCCSPGGGLRTEDVYSPCPEIDAAGAAAGPARVRLPSGRPTPATAGATSCARTSRNGASVVTTRNTVIKTCLAVDQFSGCRPLYSDDRLQAVERRERARSYGHRTHQRSCGAPMRRSRRLSSRSAADCQEDARMRAPRAPRPDVSARRCSHPRRRPDILVFEPLVPRLTDSCRWQRGGGRAAAESRRRRPVWASRSWSCGTRRNGRTVEAGTARLVGTSRRRHGGRGASLIRDASAYRRSRGDTDPYGEIVARPSDGRRPWLLPRRRTRCAALRVPGPTR